EKGTADVVGMKEDRALGRTGAVEASERRESIEEVVALQLSRLVLPDLFLGQAVAIPVEVDAGAVALATGEALANSPPERIVGVRHLAAVRQPDARDLALGVVVQAMDAVSVVDGDDATARIVGIRSFAGGPELIAVQDVGVGHVVRRDQV